MALHKQPHSVFNLACTTATPLPVGVCGGCGDTAYHPLEDICINCAHDLSIGINKFPTYTYPSELMYNNTDSNTKRLFFFRSNNH